MGKPQRFISGDPWVCCDRCGADYRYSQTLKEYTGLRVCRQCWDYRHPQEYVRGVVERRAVKDARPEPPDVGVTVSWTWDEVATGWSGTVSQAVVNYRGSWFVDGWFSPDGWFRHLTPVLYLNTSGFGGGVIYETPPLHYINMWFDSATVSCTFDYDCYPMGYATAKVQYAISTDCSTWGAWTDYSTDFTASLFLIKWRIWVTETSTPYTLIVSQFSYTVVNNP